MSIFQYDGLTNALCNGSFSVTVTDTTRSQGGFMTTQADQSTKPKFTVNFIR